MPGKRVIEICLSIKVLGTCNVDELVDVVAQFTQALPPEHGLSSPGYPAVYELKDWFFDGDPFDRLEHNEMIRVLGKVQAHLTDNLESYTERLNEELAGEEP